MAVSFLHRGDEADASKAGQLAASLSKIARARIPIVPTAMLPNTAFAAYISGRLAWDDVELALAGLETEMPTADLIIRASLPIPTMWCETGLQVRRSSAEMQNAVQRIFRSVTSPRSRASRVAAQVSDEDAAPAILIQPKLAVVGSLLSRHAVTGQPVSEGNWRDNINNNLETADTETFIELCRRAEEALGAPSYFAFSSKPTPAIVNVERPTMTDSGWLTALLDLYRKRSLSAIELLRQVQPSVFGYFTGRFKLNQTARIGRLSGIEASPGQVIGMVVVRGYTERRAAPKLRMEMPPVLFLVESTPDDLHEISASAATVQSLGGKSCHLAVMSRGMAKPCVVGSSIAIDERKRCLTLPDGMRVNEGSIVAVDANNGVLEFGESPDLVQDTRLPWIMDETKAEVIAILEAETTSARFRELSIEDQTHLAAIKLRLRELNILP